MADLNAERIIELIRVSTKKTPVKVYVKGNLANLKFGSTVHSFIEGHTGVVFGEWNDIEPVLKAHAKDILDFVVENDCRNSAIPLLDTKAVNARIEPGSVIRSEVEIGDNAVIMMGAVINIGAVIGAGTMIDMNAVVGGRAIIGSRCHIGAGAVVAGVIEPPSATPVIIEDNVLVGANAVLLEGVHVGEGAVIAAGAVVTKDVLPHTVVAGMPAVAIKKVDAKTMEKTEIIDELRHL